jgi:hypothetical protein
VALLAQRLEIQPQVHVRHEGRWIRVARLEDTAELRCPRGQPGDFGNARDLPLDR